MQRDELSPLEMAAWGGFMRSHTLVYQELGRRLVKSHGISLTAYDVLLRLTWAGRDGIRMSDLAAEVMMTSGGLTRVADRLERDGLIERVRSADDMRGYVARITPVGRRTLRSANRRHLADVRELFLEYVTEDERVVLARVWGRIKAAQGADRVPVGRGRNRRRPAERA
jgi:DNA-binding MarR family transcriptional regulator